MTGVQTCALPIFSEFQAIYPNDSLSFHASEYIKELRDKLGEREIHTAELYRKMLSPNSALIYYESTISNYPDTKFLEPAYIGKIEVLIQMKRYDEALTTIDVFRRAFPNSQNLELVASLEKTIPK